MIASTFIAALFAVGAVATKPTRVQRRGGDGVCLNGAQASQVAATWASLIANYSTELAEITLVEDFTDYSESVNSLINNCPQGSAAMAMQVPLLGATFTNRTAFEIGQSQQPPLEFDVLKVFPGCGAISFRWMTNNTAPIPSPRPVVGNIIIETQQNPDASSEYPFLIDTVYSEFDSGDWIRNLEDAGICATTACSATATATGVSTVTVTPVPTITSGPTYESSTSTDAEGNVYVIITEVDDVYVTATDVVTVTAS